jgi:hypothetical protein
MKLTKAQIAALKMAKRHDHPAGKPRRRWFRASTLAVLVRHGLVDFRPHPDLRYWMRPVSEYDFVDLTPAGRAALHTEEE